MSSKGYKAQLDTFHHGQQHPFKAADVIVKWLFVVNLSCILEGF
jgi:hypothetical protein